MLVNEAPVKMNEAPGRPSEGLTWANEALTCVSEALTWANEGPTWPSEPSEDHLGSSDVRLEHWIEVRKHDPNLAKHAHVCPFRLRVWAIKESG